MKTQAASEFLPPGVSERLTRVTAVSRRSSRMEHVLRLAAVFVLLAVAAMMADAALRLFHPAARWLASLTVVAVFMGVGFRWRRVKGRITPADAARAVEEGAPGLQERWSTLASLDFVRNPLLRGSPELIDRVKMEAAQLASTVPAGTREAGKSRNRALLWGLGGIGVPLLFHAADAERSGVLWHRLAAPWSDVSLTRINVVSHPESAVVPRHEHCELGADLSGRPVDSAVLLLKQAGEVSEIPLSADRLAAVPFRHSLRDPAEDFSFRFRAGDGQTPWHHVRVADRPVIQAASVTVTPPAYTGQPPERHPGVPSKLRVLEGGTLTVYVTPGRGSDRVRLALASPDKAWLLMRAAGDRRFTVSLTPEKSMRFFPEILSAEGLENRQPPVCEVEVVADRPPVVILAEDSAAEAITPADVIEVAFTAADDVGVQQAEIVVTVEKEGSPPREIAVPVPLGDEAGKREITRRVPLDLSRLPLEPGAKISYAVRARDGKAAEAEVARKKEQNDASSGQNEKEVKAGDKKPGAPKPPVTMATRELDLAGQCSCSASKNLEIEGYTGDSPAFREKKSLPVLPALTRISAAVKEALRLTTQARNGMRPGKAAAASTLSLVGEAKKQTDIAEKEAAAFTATTAGTPYAMIGLDLENLRGRELTPALGSLTVLPEAADAVPEANRAGMHLRAAAAWLERLMAKTEHAAKEEAAAGLARKVKEMHRIFLEDTLNILNLSNAKGAAVPELPLIEVGQEYARLLEKKLRAEEEVMEELAALLAKDPELLAKFTLNRSKGADALQTQAAGLAREQAELNRRTAGPGARAGAKEWTDFLRQETALRQGAVAEELGSLMRGAVAWFPRSIPREEPEAVAFFDAMLRAASLPPAENAARLKALDRVMKALDAVGRLNGGASWAAKQRGKLTEIKRSQDWLCDFSAAVNGGRMERAAGLLQRDLEWRTRVLAAKIERRSGAFAALSGAIGETARAINQAYSGVALPAQTAAVGALEKSRWRPAEVSQREALVGLEAASRGCGEMIRLIAEEMRNNPPPPPVPGEMAGARSLESLLAMMEREMEAAEDFSLPRWKLNVQLMKDWASEGEDGGGSGSSASEQPAAKPGEEPAGETPDEPAESQSGEKPGDKAGESSASAAMEQEMRAAAGQARELAAAAAKVQQEANARARLLAGTGEESSTPKAAAVTRARRDDWNKLPSKLGKDIRQQHDAPPPEEYRRAVETYFRRTGAGWNGAESR